MGPEAVAAVIDVVVSKPGMRALRTWDEMPWVWNPSRLVLLPSQCLVVGKWSPSRNHGPVERRLPYLACPSCSQKVAMLPPCLSVAV